MVVLGVGLYRSWFHSPVLLHNDSRAPVPRRKTVVTFGKSYATADITLDESFLLPRHTVHGTFSVPGLPIGSLYLLEGKDEKSNDIVLVYDRISRYVGKM